MGGFTVRFFLLVFLFGAFSMLTRNFSGIGGGLIKGGERHKLISRDAAILSWEMILFYAFLRLLALVPFLKQLFNHEKTSILSSNSFFTNGGDILIIGLIGYVIGFFESYLKRSKMG